MKQKNLGTELLRKLTAEQIHLYPTYPDSITSGGGTTLLARLAMPGRDGKSKPHHSHFHGILPLFIPLVGGVSAKSLCLFGLRHKGFVLPFRFLFSRFIFHILKCHKAFFGKGGRNFFVPFPKWRK